MYVTFILAIFYKIACISSTSRKHSLLAFFQWPLSFQWHLSVKVKKLKRIFSLNFDLLGLLPLDIEKTTLNWSQGTTQI